MPMEDCHGLMLELESIQRGILYHCPVLVHACIPQAITRMPLLYVNAGEDPDANQKLFKIVDQMTRKHFIPHTPTQDNGSSKSGQDGSVPGDSNPFMLRFQSLEVDGARNEVLQTVGEAEGADRLQEYVRDVEEQCQAQGWTTKLPPDPQFEGNFRPRVPFMRLPGNWDELLDESNASDDNDAAGEERYLTSDEGGNGISPIFWFKWSGDDFGSFRMREIALFQRRAGFEGLNEQSFYLPFDSISLPTGDNSMTEQERKFSDYQERRMEEAEKVQAGLTDNIPTPPADDMLLSKTRERLELLYDAPFSEDPSLDEGYDDTMLSNAPDFASNAPSFPPSEPEESLEQPRPQTTNDTGLDEGTQQRIDQIIANRQKARIEVDLSTPKDKPPVEQNKIFQKYKEGTLVPAHRDDEVKPELPPFPNRGHCVGFWKVITSPTGFEVEEGGATRSDNLILRVDGTTAGGPILDRETRQKAAGGTWRLHGNTSDDSTLLIRLVIPPHKDRILVMCGTLAQTSLSTDVALAPSSFGIPALEERQARTVSELDNMLLCSGEVWIEDAVTKENRQDIGAFSLMKMEVSSSPDSYTITIPRPVRNQD